MPPFLQFKNSESEDLKKKQTHCSQLELVTGYNIFSGWIEVES